MKPFVTLLDLAIALIVLSLVFAQKRGVGDLRMVKKPLLMKRERAALMAIEAAFPNYRAYP